MKRIVFAVIFLSAFFCLPVFAGQVVSSQDFNGVILTDREDPFWAETIAKVTQETPSDYWIPSKEDILGAEKQLKDFLEQSPDMSLRSEFGEDEPASNYAKIWKYLSDYDRQYIGFIVDNERKIYFNCVAKWAGTRENWETKLKVPFLMGGGIYRFEAIYDMKKGAFTQLEITDGGPE